MKPDRNHRRQAGPEPTMPAIVILALTSYPAGRQKRLFLLGLFRGRGLHFAHGAGFAAGRAFLGFATGVHLIAAFFTGKDGHREFSKVQKRY
jgi:hypothetical protein